jgi:endonuclease YncB( thermonuclease family)
VLLLTYGCDMYGRYLADVFYSGPQSEERPTVESGRFLNIEILEKGIAGFWDAMRWE